MSENFLIGMVAIGLQIGCVAFQLIYEQQFLSTFTRNYLIKHTGLLLVLMCQVWVEEFVGKGNLIYWLLTSASGVILIVLCVELYRRLTNR